MAELFGPLLYFNVLSLKDKNSLSFTRFQCIVLGSAALFSSFENVLKLKRGDLISWGETILECRTAELFGSPFCISFLQVWRNQVIFSFIRFQCIVHDSAGTFIDFQNSLKLKRGELISWGGTNSTERLNYLVLSSAFQVQNFEELKIFIFHQISICHAWLSSVSHVFSKFGKIQEGRPYFLTWKPIL